MNLSLSVLDVSEKDIVDASNVTTSDSFSMQAGPSPAQVAAFQTQTAAITTIRE
jgi:hypothetical protein